MVFSTLHYMQASGDQARTVSTEKPEEILSVPYKMVLQTKRRLHGSQRYLQSRSTRIHGTYSERRAKVSG